MVKDAGSGCGPSGTSLPFLNFNNILLNGHCTKMNDKILIAEDEKTLNKLISDYLESVGFLTFSVFNGNDAVAGCVSERPDLVIMDIMLPGLDGIEATRKIRSESDIPVIILTAKAEESDKLLGLEIGADDYMVKPFSIKELSARIRVVLRRYRSSISVIEKAAGNVILGDIEIDTVSRVVRLKGLELNLTAAQFALLKTMAESPGRVFSRMELLNSFQDTAFDGYERTIDVHIKNIRKALGDDSSAPKYIQTVWGIGYKSIPQ
jgi:DNA-binding response OmpR family regulator